MADVFRISAFRADSARGGDRALGGNLMRRRLARSRAAVAGDVCSASSCAAGAAHRLDERLHRPGAADAGRSRADSGPQPILADAWVDGDASRYPRLSGGAEDVLVLKPDVVVTSAFDKRSTRELLKANGLQPRRTRRCRATLTRSRTSFANSATSPAIPIARRVKSRGSTRRLPRARQAVADKALSRAAAVAARLGGGQRQFCRLAAGRNRAVQHGRRTRLSISAVSPRWRRS